MKKGLLILLILIGLGLQAKNEDFSLFKLYNIKTYSLFEKIDNTPKIDLKFSFHNPRLVNFSYSLRIPMNSFNLDFFMPRYSVSRFISSDAKQSSRFQNLEDLDYNYIAYKNRVYNLSSSSNLKLKSSF